MLDVSDVGKGAGMPTDHQATLDPSDGGRFQLHKIIDGTRMLNNVQQYGLMPDEVISECNCTVDEGSLSKVLFYDISQQTRLSAGISSVDADNCYDRVLHAIASLVF